MSAAAARLPLSDAIAAAERFRALFDGCYDRWEVAGSVRRMRPEVGDIEHVVISRNNAGLFTGGDPTWQVPVRARRLCAEGPLKKHVYPDGRTRFGEKYFGVELDGVTHEVFCCTAENWGCILAIRTGPADLSHRLVNQLHDHGYRQHEGYLYLRGRNGDLADLYNNRIADQWYRRIDCPDETTFFRAAGYPGAPPPECR